MSDRRHLRPESTNDRRDGTEAAQAEAGNFEEAVKWQKVAFELFTEQPGRKKYRGDYQERLKTYESRRPYRQPFRKR